MRGRVGGAGHSFEARFEVYYSAKAGTRPRLVRQRQPEPRGSKVRGKQGIDLESMMIEHFVCTRTMFVSTLQRQHLGARSAKSKH
jgi:hypothetical protein